MYIKRDVNFLEIPKEVFPTFKYEFARPATIDDKELAKEIANNNVSEETFRLLKILLNFRFVSFGQLVELLEVGDADKLRARLNKLVSKRMINSMTLSDENGEPMRTESDALTVYCLDATGLALLLHKYDSNFVRNYPVYLSCQTSANMISKRLFAVDFYLQLVRSIGKENIHMFRCEKDFAVNKSEGDTRVSVIRYQPSFVFTVIKNGLYKNYVAQAFVKDELGADLIDELTIANNCVAKIGKDFESNPDEERKAPTYLVFTNDDAGMAMAATRLVENCQGIPTYRLSTTARVASGVGTKGAFCKLEENSLDAVTIGAFKK